jgi:hypothetical protein
MTKDSMNSPIKPPGRRAIAYANANAKLITNAYGLPYAQGIPYTNANANAYDNAYAIANAQGIPCYLSPQGRLNDPHSAQRIPH